MIKKFYKKRFSYFITYKILNTSTSLFYNGSLDSWDDYGKTYSKLDDCKRALSMIKNNNIEGDLEIIRFISKLVQVEEI